MPLNSFAWFLIYPIHTNRQQLKLFDRHCSQLHVSIPSAIASYYSTNKERKELVLFIDERIKEIMTWYIPSDMEHYDDEEEDETGEDIMIYGNATMNEKMKASWNRRMRQLRYQSKRNSQAFRIWWRATTPEMKWFLAKLVLPLTLNYIQGLHVLLWQRKIATQREKDLPVFPLF